VSSTVGLRANFQPSYLWRYLIMAGTGLFMAAWFAYDGLVGYPKEMVRAQAYEVIERDSKDLRQRVERWQEMAKSKSWATSTPEKKAAEIKNDILGQYIFGFLSLCLAVPALYLYIKSKDRWIESTATGLKSSWGQELHYADVTELHKHRWERKGIAKAHYQVNGQPNVFVFDDFKYERKPLGQMLQDLERVIPHDKIIGGSPEPLEQPDTEAPDNSTTGV
jgi:hypothetical protein